MFSTHARSPSCGRLREDDAAPAHERTRLRQGFGGRARGQGRTAPGARVVRRVEHLREQIRLNDYRYYVLGLPTISDAALDALVKELEVLEVHIGGTGKTRLADLTAVSRCSSSTYATSAMWRRPDDGPTQCGAAPATGAVMISRTVMLVVLRNGVFLIETTARWRSALACTSPTEPQAIARHR